MEEACCTCAQLLSAVPRYDAASEKPLPADRRLSCCGRVICGRCIHSNARFSAYCPYCQVSESSSSGSSSSVLPLGLTDPPSYDAATSASQPPPPYTASPTATDGPSDRDGDPKGAKSKTTTTSAAAKDSEPPTAEDTLHFLRQPDDTVASLSLRYGVPAAALRRANRLHSDHLLQGRRTVLIPGTHYQGGASLSPRPVEGEEEEQRARALRRFMVRCKVPDYDAARLYLAQAGGDLEAAVERYLADEAWERAHPITAADRAGRRGWGGSGSLTAMLGRGR